MTRKTYKLFREERCFGEVTKRELYTATTKREIEKAYNWYHKRYKNDDNFVECHGYFMVLFGECEATYFIVKE